MNDAGTIEAIDLSKRYGSTLAVDRLSFQVRPGIVTGFLGPNGSGKSTTMRMILGLDNPTGGTARVNGKPYRRLRVPLREVLDIVGLEAVARKRSKGFSLGMGQRLGIAAALLGDPRILMPSRSTARKKPRVADRTPIGRGETEHGRPRFW